MYPTSNIHKRKLYIADQTSLTTGLGNQTSMVLLDDDCGIWYATIITSLDGKHLFTLLESSNVEECSFQSSQAKSGLTSPKRWKLSKPFKSRRVSRLWKGKTA